MPEINISIENKTAAVLGSPLITCGNSDYIVNFAFDAEWEGHTEKTARFLFYKKGQWQYIDVVFTGAQAAVPVLADIAFVEVGVFAGDLRTTTGARIPCRRSILCEGGNPPDPSPEVYSQIMKLLEENFPLEAGIEARAAAVDAREAMDELAAGGYIKSMEEQNKGKLFSVWVGTEEEYENDPDKLTENRLHLTTDGEDVAEMIEEIWQNIGVPLVTNEGMEKGDEVTFDRGDYSCFVFRMHSDADGGTVGHIIINAPASYGSFAFLTSAAGFTLLVNYSDEDHTLSISEAKYGDDPNESTMVTDIYGVKSPALTALATSINDAKEKHNRDFYIENTGLGSGGSYTWSLPGLSTYNLISIKVATTPDMGLPNTALLAYAYDVEGTKTYHAEAHDGDYDITAVYNEETGAFTITNNSQIYDIIIVGLIGVM